MNSPSTIPQIEGEVAHELDMAVLHINGSTEAPHILGDIVAEDDRAHRGLARATLAHQEHLSLLLAGIHGWCAGCR